MIKTTSIASAAIMAACLALAPAQAAPLSMHAQSAAMAKESAAPVLQIKHKRGDALSPKQVHRILRHQGFRNIRVAKVYHNAVVAIADGRRGVVRLTVDRRNGHLIERRLIRPHYRGHGGFRDHGGFQDRGHTYRGNGVTFSFRFGH